MRKVIIALLVVVVIVVAAPFVNGLMMERAVHQYLDNVNQMYDEMNYDLSFELVDYQRGYSTSTIEYRVKFPQLQMLYGFDEIVIVDQAKHGLTEVVAKSTFEKNPQYSSFLEKYFDGYNPLSIITTYSLFGDIETIMEWEECSLAVEEVQIQIKPATFLFGSDMELSHLSYEGTWEGLFIDDVVRIDPLTIDWHADRISTFLWDGNGTIALSGMEGLESKQQFELKNLSVGYDLNYNEAENSISTSVSYGLDMAEIQGNLLEDGFIRFGIENIDATDYEELIIIYMDMFNSIGQQLQAAGDDAEEQQRILEEQMMANSFQLMASLEKMLKKGLSIEMSDIKADVKEGEIRGRIKLGLIENVTFAQMMPAANNPMLLLDYISLESELQLPSVLVGDNPMLITPVYPGMQTGLFELNGEYLTHSAETRDKKLFLNGEEVQF